MSRLPVSPRVPGGVDLVRVPPAWGPPRTWVLRPCIGETTFAPWLPLQQAGPVYFADFALAAWFGVQLVGGQPTGRRILRVGLDLQEPGLPEVHWSMTGYLG